MTIALRAALVWRGTVLAEQHSFGPSVRCGSETFPASIADEDLLAEIDGEVARIHVGAGARFTHRDSAGRVGQETGPTEVELAPGESGILHCGDLAVYFQWVDAAELGTPLGFYCDYNVAASFAASATAHAAFLMAAFLFADATPTAESTPWNDRFTRVLVAEPPDVIEELETPDAAVLEGAGASAR